MLPERYEEPPEDCTGVPTTVYDPDGTVAARYNGGADPAQARIEYAVSAMYEQMAAALIRGLAEEQRSRSFMDRIFARG